MSINGNNAYKKFADQYKVNQDELNKLGNVTYVDRYLRDSDKLSWKDRNDVIEAIEQSIKRQEAKKEKNKRKLKRPKQQKKVIFTGKLKSRIIALGLSAVVLIGGYGLYSQYQQQNEPIRIEQALENGENVNSLGIDSNILSKIQEIEKTLERADLTNEEIIGLASEIYELELDTIKTKLANTLDITEDKISVHTAPTKEGKTRETVEIIGGETYRNKDLFTWENTISSEIADYIIKIGEMQEVNEKVKEEVQKGNKNINREASLKTYAEMIKATSQFAAGIVKNDGNGNLSLEQTRQKDIATKQEESTMDEGLEL